VKSVEEVERGASLVNSTGAQMADILDSVKQVGQIFAEIGGELKDQAGGIETIERAIRDVDATTQLNSALVEELTAATASLESQANALTGAVDRFRIDAAAGGDAARERADLAQVA
jgi:methyl-accepting chemotaxis protein